MTWFTTPWLYAECYLYRRLATLFRLSTHWRNYDVFARQKNSTFRSSRPAVLELASRYQTLITELQSADGPSTKDKSPEDLAAAEKLLFTEMAEICLWGNATDLSLLTSLTYDDIQKLQGAEARKKAEANIVVNDLSRAYEVLKAAQISASSSSGGEKERQVDIVLDNAGFELYVDLLFAGYLLASNLASRVVLHPKSIPWFVSDVTPSDWAALINAMRDPQAFFTQAPDLGGDGDESATEVSLTDQEEGDMQFVFRHLSALHEEGRMVMRGSDAWTGAGSFWRLKVEEPGLWEDLRSSEMVVFKGDLNYRKLTGDVCEVLFFLPASLFSTRLSCRFSCFASFLPVLHISRRLYALANVDFAVSLSNFFKSHCADLAPQGDVAFYNLLLRCPGFNRSWFGDPHPSTEDVQSRCRGWLARRQRRRVVRYRGWWWEQRREEMGLERQVGCCAVLRWEGGRYYEDAVVSSSQYCKTA